MLFAFAMKKTLAHVGDELDTVPAVALCGGPALMLLAFWAMRRGSAGRSGGEAAGSSPGWRASC